EPVQKDLLTFSNSSIQQLRVCSFAPTFTARGFTKAFRPLYFGHYVRFNRSFSINHGDFMPWNGTKDGRGADFSAPRNPTLSK
ncbi:MAG: hypothetical protein AAFU58_11535, partial [Pseudomonadota bacterium]